MIMLFGHKSCRQFTYIFQYCSRDLHSYLLGDQEENENNANQQPNNQPARNNNAIPVVGEGLHAAHQAILQQGGPVGFQPYRRPLKFPLRVSGSGMFPLYTAQLIGLLSDGCCSSWLHCLLGIFKPQAVCSFFTSSLRCSS